MPQASLLPPPPPPPPAPDTFVYWVKERERIRIRKERGETPLTTDPIFKWRFCNVHRERDRVTIWIRRNIRERFPEHPALWWMLCAARVLNWPPTLGKLMSPEFMGGTAWPTHRKFSPAVL